MMSKTRIAVALCAALLLAACDQRDNAVPDTAPPIGTDQPNNFLHFLNGQYSLAAGSYTVVAATHTAGEAGTFHLTVTHDDGSTETHDGSWTSSGGESATSTDNPSYALELAQAGGVRIAIDSTVDTYLYLLKDGVVVAEDDNSGGGTAALIDLAKSAIANDAYAAAYYAAVDPFDERLTLDDWKKRNCFLPGNAACIGETIGYDTHVVFRDHKDLGYGRDMYARHNSDGSVAVYVQNYVVALTKGDPSNYGPINVEAAVREDAKFHAGTNAIEFSPAEPLGVIDEKIAKFFTFSPTGDQPRLLKANLDGRGPGYVPQACLVCHGGKLLPLDPDGNFPLYSLRAAKMNQLEVDSFEYSTAKGYSREDLEPGIRLINQLVRGTFQEMDTRPAGDTGRWSPDFATEIAEGRYGGTAMDAAAYDTTFVPEGWRQTAARPEGVELLYKKVIEPHCVACHSLQGTSAGEGITVSYLGQTVSLANAINFSSYEKFISYKDKVIDYVYRRGAMPASLRNYEDFWKDPSAEPSLLASFLSGFDLYEDGKVVAPGAPVAKPGVDRRVRSPVQLDGNASLFADTFAWSIVSKPVGAGASLSDTASRRPVLTVSADGDYVIGLVVTNARGASVQTTQTITVDSSLAKHQSALTFVDDIMPILGSNTTNSNCVLCHRANTPYPGIPASWRSDNANLWRDIRARVDLKDPENSLLLRKPTSLQHGGGKYLDLTDPSGLADYNTMLNWIRGGARCGSDPAICP